MGRFAELCAIGVLTGMTLAAQAEEPAAPTEPPNPLAELNWIIGPAEVNVGGHAKLVVPEGFAYLEPSDTRKFQELVQNPSDGRESMIAPEDLNWFGLFEFDDIGYVKDDEEIDAADLLESVRSGTEAANEERRRRGWQELKIVGWKFEPRYDTTTNRLEWAIIGASGGEQSINFNTRLLGRKGVTSATLVAAPEDLDAATIAFKDLLEGFTYLPGERYADVQEGDRIAEFGLAALIAGGGAAVAAKAGLFKYLGKFLVAIGVAVMAGLRALFGRKKQAA